MESIIEAIETEIQRLNAAKALLLGDTLLRGLPQERPKKRTMSVKARKLIAAAQRKRWADSKKLQREKAA